MNDMYILYDTYAQVGCYSFIPLELRPWGPYDKITSESHFIEKFTTEAFIRDLSSLEHFFKKKYTGNSKAI
jgi:hypothetical protein